MAKNNKNHIIEKQIINLEIEGAVNPEEINEIQQNLIYLFKKELGDELENILDEISPEGIEIQVSRLEIEIEEVSFKNKAELEREIIKKFKKSAKKQIKDKLNKILKENKDTPKSKKKLSRFLILETFLKTGYYPSWASTNNGTISEIFDELVNKRPKDLANRIFRMGKNENVRERLFQQFSVEQLEKLFELYYGRNSKSATKQMKLIQKRFGKNTKKAIYSSAINYALSRMTSVGVEFDEKSFTRKIVEDVQNRKVGKDSKTKVRPGFEGKYKDFQILEYFLQYGAIPDWSQVDSNKSLQELFRSLLDKDLIKLQYMVERHIHKSGFSKRLVFQFDDNDILGLLEPVSGDNVKFIKDCISDFDFLGSERQNITQKIGKSQIRSVILNEVLDYFFYQQKTKFVRKTFLKSVLNEFSKLTKTDYNDLIKESYKVFRRKKKSSGIQSTLKNLDSGLQVKLKKEKEELLIAKKELRKIDKDIKKLKDSDLAGLTKLKQKYKKLEKIIHGLEDEGMPLEIELLLQHQQELQNKLQHQNEKEAEKLKNRLDNVADEFSKLYEELSKEIENLLRDKKKLAENIGTIAENRIKRVDRRLGKYHQAVTNITNQLIQDQKGLTIFLQDINKALRGKISAEEKKSLRKERSRLQKELIKLNEYIEELNHHEEKLKETLQSALLAIDSDEELAETTPTSKLDALVFMLKYGSTPWWAKDFAKQSIEEMFIEFSVENPEKLKSTFQQIGKYPVVWERTINQLSENAIKKILSQLFPSAIKTIFAKAELLSVIHFSQGFSQLSSVNNKKFKWALLFEYLLSSREHFNPNNFYREITLQTARLYNIPPNLLIEYSRNVINNRKGDLKVFEDLNRLLLKDKRVAELDRELVVLQRKKKQKEQGLFLTDSQKSELLVDFFSFGKINNRARELNYDSIESFENLLLEQIQINRSNTKHVILTLLKLSNARSLIIKDLSDESFWEIVHLVKPKALLSVKRHFKDFSKVMDDKSLYLEKDVLLVFFTSQKQENFEIQEYLKALLMMKQQMSGRKLIAILLEWKRKILSKSGRSSSFLLSVIMMELQTLKQQQKQSTDAALVKNIQQQLESLAKEYTELSKGLGNVLAEEAAEGHGIPQKDYKLSELEILIGQLGQKIVDMELEKTDALKSIENKRKILLYKAQIQLLELRRPPLLRKAELRIKALSESLTLLDKTISAQEIINDNVEDLLEVSDSKKSLPELQTEMISAIQSSDPSALKQLPLLIQQLSDEKKSHYLYFKELERIAVSLKDEKYRNSVLEILKDSILLSEREVDLINNDKINEDQQKLLKKIGAVSPLQLWKEWDALSLYYEDNPGLYTKEKEEVQGLIYNLILRADKKNILAYTKMLSDLQYKLNLDIEGASTIVELDDLKKKLSSMWKSQLDDIDDMTELQRDPETEKDLKLFRQNVVKGFSNMQNMLNRYIYSIHNKKVEDLKNEQVKQKMEIKDLELKIEFIKDEINKAEEPEDQEPVVKKRRKRKKKVPVPEVMKEPLYIYNAGLVLLWPYMSRLFSMLKYTEGKNFVNIETQYKAIHLLQYLATGRSEAPENELLLNKIICNFPITEPVPFGVEFTPDELKMAEGLLVGAIKNWPKMKNMSPNSLRGSFLIREGTIEELEDRWVLKVTKKAFDVLLKSLPWGYTFIKFPWLEKHISVEWKLF